MTSTQNLLMNLLLTLVTKENRMNAKKVFEAIMRTKGHTDFHMSETGKYMNPGLQTRWSYFQLGWEMKEAMK